MPTSDPRSYIGAFAPKPPDTSAYDELSRGAVLQTLADRAAGRRSAATDRAAGRRSAATDAAGLTSMDRRVAGDIEITNLSNVAEMNRKAFAEGLVGPQTISDIGVTPEAVAEYSALKRGQQQADVLTRLAESGGGTPVGSSLDISGITPKVAPDRLFQGVHPTVKVAQLEFQAQQGRKEVIQGTIGPDGKWVGATRDKTITREQSQTMKGNEQAYAALAKKIIAFVQKQNPGANVYVAVDFTDTITVAGEQRVIVLVDGSPVTVDVDPRLFP